MKTVSSLWHGKGNECYRYEDKNNNQSHLHMRNSGLLCSVHLKWRSGLHIILALGSAGGFSEILCWIPQECERIFLFMFYCTFSDVFKLKPEFTWLPLEILLIRKISNFILYAGNKIWCFNCLDHSQTRNLLVNKTRLFQSNIGFVLTFLFI